MTNELMFVRITIAQMVSFFIVAAVYIAMRRRTAAMQQ